MKKCLNTATTRGYPLQDDIMYCGMYGFTGMEIDTLKLDEYLAKNSPGDLKKEMEDAGIDFAALMAFPFTPFSDSPAGLEEIKKYSGLASSLGCRILLAYMSGKPQEGVSREEALGSAVLAATMYGDAARESGLKVALEPIGRHPFMPGPAQALEVIEKSGHPSLGLVIDTFHCFRSGVSPSDLEAIPAGRILMVHVNDSEDKPVEVLNDANRLYPGKGILPLGGYLQALEKNGYGGYVSVEIFRPEYWKDRHENIIRNASESLDIFLSREE